MAGQKGKGDKGKGKGKSDKGKGKGDKGSGKGQSETTAFVRGLPFSADEDSLREEFAACGEIEKINMPLNDEGKPKGIAFIQYKEKDALEAALKKDSSEFGGRTIYVSKAGDRGDKGKGKGKDKGKGKGKKGKGKVSSERQAAKDGSLVESTGKKQTFADSDDEPAPPKKKAKKAPVEDDEDDE
eukprot:SRR837773.20555.p1 GENE.SRR837773.20555~~SRR837773.20555.p1  ORF type:complete len:184 (+),score=92.70 SRR837773.20555:428-979(+)